MEAGHRYPCDIFIEIGSDSMALRGTSVMVRWDASYLEFDVRRIAEWREKKF